MAELNPCGFLEARGDHHARTHRHTLSSLIGVSGVLGPGDLQVTELDGTPDMAVRVASGAGVIEGTRQTRQGAYNPVNDGAVTKPIAASESSPRRDLVIAQVLDSEQTGSEDLWRIHVVTGVAAAEPVDPVIPEDAFPLARVRVPALADQITDDDIDDLRPFARLRAQLLKGVDLDDWIPTEDGHLVTLGHMRDSVMADVSGGWRSAVGSDIVIPVAGGPSVIRIEIIGNHTGSSGTFIIPRMAVTGLGGTAYRFVGRRLRDGGDQFSFSTLTGEHFRIGNCGSTSFNASLTLTRHGDDWGMSGTWFGSAGVTSDTNEAGYVGGRVGTGAGTITSLNVYLDSGSWGSDSKARAFGIA